MDVGRDAALVRRDLVAQVLHAVRRLGTARSLDDALQGVVDHVVSLLGFTAAALNVGDDDGAGLVVRTVSGPDGVQQLVGGHTTRAEWERLLALCVPRGGLLFYDDRAAGRVEIEGMPRWTQPATDDDSVGVWHARDTLLAPVRDDAGQLVLVLSADGEAGSQVDVDQLAALELFAAEAGSALRERAAREHADRLRRTAERRLRFVWDNGLVGGAVLDENGVVLDVNEQGAAMLGWEPSELVGRRVLDVVPAANHGAAVARLQGLVREQGSWVQERQLQHRDGHVLWTSMHAVALIEGPPVNPVVIVQWIDVTEQKAAAQTLAHQLDHDTLTDLPNRRHLERSMTELFDGDGAFGVISYLVDGLNSVLDGLGHEAADDLLVQVARRLCKVCGDGVFVGRVSPGEFVVLVAGADDTEDLVVFADRLGDVLAAPFSVGGTETLAGISVGLSVRDERHTHPVDVLREAEEALKRARQRGHGHIEVFDPRLDRPVTRADMELEVDLRRDLDHRQHLEPRFQSVISLESGVVAGFELLLRWRHPRFGMLLPDRFMPVAERGGLSADVGWRVLELLAEAGEPPDGVSGPVWIAVNVSAAQLGRGRLLEGVRRLLDSPFSATYAGLHLEITETSLLEATPAVIDELYAVVDLGARLALDDFGTGYSSLTLLRDLPVSTVKIDRSFIQPIAVDIRARTIVQHAIELCHGLGMTTIAEGIETHEQLAWLQTLGCEFGQGFLIDQPSAWRAAPLPGDVPGDAPGGAPVGDDSPHNDDVRRFNG